MTKPLDLDFVRQQFPAFSEPDLTGQAFFENAGGSYACKQVIDLLTSYYRETKVQPYHPFPAAQKAGAAMDNAYSRFADYLNVAEDEVLFGPSTSQNTYVLAAAMADYLQEGDEIIVTNQDHEANGGAWRRLATRGIIVHEWSVNLETASLETSGLKALLNEKTKLVCFPHCSNIVGEINPVATWTSLAHKVGAFAVVDGVSYAGHGFPDIEALGADIYLFSLYKTYGPHQGAMVVRQNIMSELVNQSHYFNDGALRKRLIPAGPDHAQVAAAAGVTDYFDAVAENHFDTRLSGNARATAVHDLFREAELARLKPLLSYLKDHPKIQIIGPDSLENRAPTVSILVEDNHPADLAKTLASHGVMAASGHFYAARLIEALGISLDSGVLRLSFVHYTSDKDINQLIQALEKII